MQHESSTGAGTIVKTRVSDKAFHMHFDVQAPSHPHETIRRILAYACLACVRAERKHSMDQIIAIENCWCDAFDDDTQQTETSFIFSST